MSNNTRYRGSERSERDDMLQLIMDEIRYIRQKLDAHIETEDESVERVRRDIVEIKEQLATYKTKVGVISGGIALGVGAAISWVMAHLGLKP